MEPLVQTSLKENVSLLAQGKVRDVYTINDDSKTLLFVATDRISAYDVIMKNGIPQKGALLTLLSAHWFSFLSSQIPGLRTHFISLGLPQNVREEISEVYASQLEKRTMQVRRLKVFPVEAIVRGYITGSAWSEYQKKGTVHGMTITKSDGQKFQESDKFDQPIYTPSTKAEVGGKDENIHPDQAAKIVGEKYAQKIQELSITLYSKARDYAAERGIIIADTKFEFALDEETDEVVLVDEVLTPDSSRFWPADAYAVGKSQDSFDKQYIRDWLTKEGLKGREGVELPQEVIDGTVQKYREAFQMLTGKKWEEAL